MLFKTELEASLPLTESTFLILLSLALFFSFVSFYYTWQDDQSLLTEFANRDKSAENLLNKTGTITAVLITRQDGMRKTVLPVAQGVIFSMSKTRNL